MIQMANQKFMGNFLLRGGLNANFVAMKEVISVKKPLMEA
jgi:hypothetical protein